MQNLLEIQNALRSAPDQQLMGLMQGANSSVPQWAVASEMNSRKEMRDEQTRQEGLGQPTVLQQLTGTAPAPTPQTNVAGMPQGVASGMAQSMAPKTDVAQNTGIASVAPVATMASGGILKMAPGGAVNQVIVTFAEDSPIYPGETRRMTQDTLEAMPRNSVQDVKGVADVGGVEAAKKVPYLPMSGGLKRQLKTIESESFPLIDTSDRNNVPPDNYGVSASLPPADGAMYSSPTGGQGGNTDPSRLGLPKDEFSQVPVSSMSTPVGLATLAAAGDADVRGETPVVNTSTLSEKELRKQADNRNEAGRARFELMKALEATNSKGQPGGILGAKYPEGRGSYSTSIAEALLNSDPFSGELSPSQTARNQETLKNTLRREEIAQQREDSTEAGRIMRDAADTREAFSVPLESDAVETVSAGEIKPNPFAVSKTPFNATSDGAQDPKPITIDSAVKPSAEVTNAQLEAFTDAAALRNTALTVPTKPKKPEVFDPLKGLFMYQALPENNAPKTDAETIRQRINELKTPEEKAATLTMLNNRYIDAEQEVERLKEKYERVRIAGKSGTGNYAIDEKAGIGLGAGSLTDINKELIAAKNNLGLLYENIGGLVPASGYGGDFATERYFGKDTVKALNKLETDNLQAEAVADVAEATTAEPDLTAQTAGAEDYLRRQRENKELDAEAVLDAERAAGLTAGENAFTASSPVRSSLDYTTLNKTGLGLVPSAPRNQLDNPDLSYKELISKQPRDTKTGIKSYTGSAFPNTFDMDNRVVTSEGIGLVDNLTDKEKEAHRLRKFEEARKLQEEALLRRTEPAIKRASDMTTVLARAAGKEYIPELPVVPERALTSEQVITGVDNAGTAVANTGKTAVNLAAAAAGGGDNYFDFELGETTTIPPKSTTDFMVPSGAGDANITPSFNYDEPPKTDIDTSKNAAEILEKLPLIDQTVKNGVTPATRTGIATIGGSGATSRSEGQPNTSSYEQKLLDILDKREKSADQDKWLGLAEMGMRLMASSNPNALAAIGESGLGAFGSYMGKQKAQDAEELNILGKLADMDMAKQTLQARKDIAAAAASARSQKPLMTFAQIGTKLQKDVDGLTKRYAELVDIRSGQPYIKDNLAEVERVRAELAAAQQDYADHYKQANMTTRLPYQAQNTIIKVS